LGGDGCSAIARQGRGGAGHAAVAWRCAFSFRFGPNGLLLGIDLSRTMGGCGIWHWGEAKAAGAWPCGVDACCQGIGILGKNGQEPPECHENVIYYTFHGNHNFFDLPLKRAVARVGEALING
jgi:hypothetical protein